MATKKQLIASVKGNNDVTKNLPTLGAKILSACADVLSHAIGNATSVKNTMVDACKSLAKAGLPAEPTEADTIAIVNLVAESRGWTAPKYARLKQSKSDARALIRAHAKLPEGIAALIAANYPDNYGNVVRLARALAKGATIKEAIKGFEPGEGKSVDPQQRAAASLKSWYKSLRDGRKTEKRQELMNKLARFADEIGIELAA